jgi:hypothetical protein
MRAFALASLLLAACSGPRPEEFPVGFFGVEKPEHARLLAEKGYDAFQSYQTEPAKVKAVADEARRRGALFLVSHRGIIDDAKAKASDYPGTWWYLQDEPEIHGLDGAAMRAEEAKVRRWAPGMRTAFVVGDGLKASDYPGVGDAIMVDWYPVPHRPLESAGDHVRLTAAVAGGRKVWAVLQAMDWTRFAPKRKDGRRFVGRFPDIAEIRFMSYDAVLGGARGIWYFTFATSSSATLADEPELLFAVNWVAREMKAMAPIFARGRAIALPFPEPEDGWAARAWTYHGRDYLVLANRSAKRMWRVPEEALRPGWRPLFEVRRDPRELLTPLGKSHYLKPYQVLVLESRLKPARFLGM